MGDMNQDPSMEEILASIKRVIAEDGRNAAGPARPPRRVPAPPPALPPEDVLELDDPVAEGEGETLISDNAAAASRQSLAALAAMRQGAEPPPARAGEGALEAVVREMLRPILKEWLDQHLPEIVQELVTREIGRITGRPL
jgi:hypothetical protein